MKYFMGTTLAVIIVALIYIGYKHNFGREANIPIDYEQTGLSDQIVINFSHVIAENTPKGLAANKFAELVEKKTNGKVKVEVYPNSILYSDEEEMAALLNGDVQMIAPTFSKVTEIIPEWQVLDLPYIMKDYQDIKTIFTGDVGEELLDELDKVGIKGLTLWSSGFKQMTTNHNPLIHKEDFDGLQFRTMPSETLQKQFELLHAKSTNLNFDEVFSILEKHVLDSQENTISNIYSKGFYKVQKYMTVSNHGILGYAVMMNEDFWDSLSKDLQADIEEALKEVTLWNLEQSEQMNKDDLEKIKKNSPIIIHTLNGTEQHEWAEQWEPLYQNYEATINPRWIKRIQHELNE
ncbi:MAG: DctP family TRAP transporter solute-binding subunit [Bacillus sp. (in: firmicutes)]